MDKLDHMTNTPLGGIVIATGVGTVSVLSLVIEWTTLIFGCIGAVCSAIIGMRAVYIMITNWLRERNAKKNKKRRSTDS